MKVSLDKASFP